MFTWHNNCCPSPSRACPHGWVDVAAILTAPISEPDLNRFYLIGQSPTGIFEEHANQYTWFDPNVGWLYCDPAVGDKLSVDDSCGWSCWNGSAWVAGGTSSSSTYSGINLGDEQHGLILKQVTSGGQFQFRKLRGQGTVTVTTVGDEVIISGASVTGSGEVNTGQNVGSSGVGVFRNKTGLILNFRKLIAADSSMTIQLVGTDQISFKANVPDPPNWSVVNYGTAGIGPYDSVNTNEFRFRNLLAVSEDANVFDIALDAPNHNIEFTFAPSLGLLSLWGDALRLYDVAVSDDQVMTWDTDSWIARTVTISSLGTGQGTIYGGNPSPLNWRIKSLRQGTNVTITQDANEITINATGGITGFNNMGTGSDGQGLFSSIISNVAQFKRIKAGTDIFLTSETNDVLIAARSQTAGTGMTITPGATDNVFSVTNYNTLLADAAVGDSSWIKSGPPWLIRKAKAGTGITVTQNTNDVTFALNASYSTLGGGIPFTSGWSAAVLQGLSAVAGAGMDIQLVGDTLVFSVTGGGGSGAGVSGTALVGAFVNTTVATALDMWGFTATPVKFPTTSLSVATITKNGANEEFTFGKVAKWKISAKATIDTGASQTQHQMWCEVDTGGGTWSEVAGSRSYAYSTNELHDLQTIHTGEFSLNVTNLTTKVRFVVLTNGGTAAISLLAGGTMATFEEAVGPIWEVITDATTSRTLSATDNGKVLVFSNAGTVTLTLPQTMLASFACDVIQLGVGQVDMVASGAATVNSTVGTTPSTSAQHGRAHIVVTSGTGANAVYNVSGDIV